MTMNDGKAFRENLKAGDEVFWTDPDAGHSSGHYVVREILTDSGTLKEGDDILVIGNEAGSTAEVFAHELS